MPHSEINAESLAKHSKEALFVVYCCGPDCNGAAKAGFKISTLGYSVEEILGGNHYWEDF